MNWFYAKNDEQVGPVDESTLKGLVDSGEIAPNALVWKDGMPDWAPYESVFAASGASDAAVDSCPTCGANVNADELIPAGDQKVCPNCRDDYAQGLREGMAKSVQKAGTLGTGGMTPNSELRAMARSALTGNWGMAVLVVFIFHVIQQATGMIPLAGVIIQWIIMGPLSLGFVVYFMRLHRGHGAEVGALFEGFSNFVQGLGIYIVTGILVGLSAMAAAIPGGILIGLAFTGGGASPEENPLFIGGIFLAIIPAFIVATYMYLRYSMAYYIANDHPEAGVMQPIKQSVQMMQGHKKKLFFLYLSFIGWNLLGALALLVGLLWSISYMSAAVAAFYDDLGDEA